MHLHHLNCVLLDTGSGCASPLSIDGVVFGVTTWSTSRVSTVQVGQTVLDRYTPGHVNIHVCTVSHIPAHFCTLLLNSAHSCTCLHTLLHTHCYIFRLSIHLPYADLFGLPFYLSILIHSSSVTPIIVLLHCDSCYLCTI